MAEESEPLFKIRFRFPGGEEFEAQGNREFIEQQRNYFLSLIGKKAGAAPHLSKIEPAALRSFSTSTPTRVAPAALPPLSPLPPAQRAVNNRPMQQEETPADQAFPALRLWERLLKEDGDIVLLRKKMRLSPQEAALLLLAGARVLLKKPAYTALHLSRSMKKSGFSEGRLDRLLAQEIKNGHLNCDGSKRSRSYRLTNEGFARAYVLAEKLGNELL